MALAHIPVSPCTGLTSAFDPRAATAWRFLYNCAPFGFNHTALNLVVQFPRCHASRQYPSKATQRAGDSFT